MEWSEQKKGFRKNKLNELSDSNVIDEDKYYSQIEMLFLNTAWYPLKHVSVRVDLWLKQSNHQGILVESEKHIFTNYIYLQYGVWLVSRKDL